MYRRGARRWRKLYRVNGHLFQAKRFSRVSQTVLLCHQYIHCMAKVSGVLMSHLSWHKIIIITSAPIRVLCNPVRYINLLVVVVVTVTRRFAWGHWLSETTSVIIITDAPVIYLGSNCYPRTQRTAECRRNKNAPKSKLTKRTHFCQKRKPLSCLFTLMIKKTCTYQLCKRQLADNRVLTVVSPFMVCVEFSATRPAVNWHISGHLQKSTENIPVWHWHIVAHLLPWRIWAI